MAPSPEKRQLRWPTKTKRGFAGTVPDWTIAEDDDDKYDVHIMRRRSARRRVRRDVGAASAGESEVFVSILEEDPNAKQPDSKTPKEVKEVKEVKEESESGSDSESGDESGSDDENEESDDEVESDPVPSEKEETVSDQDLPVNVKLPASATDTPTVEAPSAEGSTEGSMVSPISPTPRPSHFWRRFELRHMSSALKARAC
jgi:hypothetical protein